MYVHWLSPRGKSTTEQIFMTKPSRTYTEISTEWALKKIFVEWTYPYVRQHEYNGYFLYLPYIITNLHNSSMKLVLIFPLNKWRIWGLDVLKTSKYCSYSERQIKKFNRGHSNSQVLSMWLLWKTKPLLLSLTIINSIMICTSVNSLTS